MHGSLRYLQMLDFKLVAEALRERDLLLEHTAPHLVKPIKFVFPFFKKVIDRGFIGSGVMLYDAIQSIGRKRAVPSTATCCTRRCSRSSRPWTAKAVGALSTTTRRWTTPAS